MQAIKTFDTSVRGLKLRAGGAELRAGGLRGLIMKNRCNTM